MKPTMRCITAYNWCVDAAIANLKQARYFIKENNVEGYYPDTLYSIEKMIYFLATERIIAKEGK